MDERKIKALSPKEHMRIREMTSGSKETPLQLIEEILDNSIDELQNMYADTIYFSKINNGHFVIWDNGRGIPIHDVSIELPNKELYTMDSVEAIFTVEKTGGKFDDSRNEIRIGQNGVGLNVVCFLSKDLKCIIRNKLNKKLVHEYLFKNGEFVSKKEIENTDLFSTKIEFLVDEKYFNSIIINTFYIENRLKIIKFKYPKSIIIYENKILDFMTSVDIMKSLCSINQIENFFSVNINKTLSDSKENERLNVFFTYTNDDIFSYKAEVNTKICDIEFINLIVTHFYNAIKEVLNTNVLTKNDICKGLRFFISLDITNPKFHHQVKDKFVKNVNYLLVSLQEKFVNVVLQNKKFFDNKFNDIINQKEFKSELKKTGYTFKRPKSDKIVHAHNVDNGKVGEILYMIEGESAMGHIKTSRNHNTDGVVQLKGKLRNILNEKLSSIIQSEVIMTVLNAMGCNVNLLYENEKQNFLYKYFCILTDADIDGWHITVLVLLMFWKLFPNIIKEQRFLIQLAPLYKITLNNNTKKFIYSEEELNIFKNKYNTISEIKRFKGLGAMGVDDCEQMLQGDDKKIITLMKNDNVLLENGYSEKDFVENCINNVQFKRQLCKNKIYSFNTLITYLTN